MLQKEDIEDEISIKEIFQQIKQWLSFIKSKWKLLILSLLIGGLLGFGYDKYSSPKYMALLTFAMEEDKSGGGGGGAALSGVSGLASQFGIELGSGGGGAFSAVNITELMKSRNIIEKTLLKSININNENISLAEYYIRIYNLRKKWKNNLVVSNLKFPPNAERSTFTITQDSVLKILYGRIVKNSLNIQQKDKKITIISLEVTSPDEKFSKYFCENLAIETSDFYIYTKSKKARNNVEILQKQTDSVRVELNNAIKGVATASDNVYNLNPSLNIKGAPSRRRQADVQANTAILTQLSANLELSKVTLRKETPLIQIIDTPILPLDEVSLGSILTIIIGMVIAFLITTLYLSLKRIEF